MQVSQQVPDKAFTHSGKFHADDVFSAALLTYLNHDIRLVRQCISWKTWKTPNKTINFKKLHDIYNKMFCDLITIFHFLNININDIYNIYVHKNIENVFPLKLIDKIQNRYFETFVLIGSGGKSPIYLELPFEEASKYNIGENVLVKFNEEYLLPLK